MNTHYHHFFRMLACIVGCLGITHTSFSQNENNLVEDSIIHVDAERKFEWDVSFAFKTMNVFRGLVPSKAPVFSTQGGVGMGDFILGFYGGASTNGSYTETDLILVYYRPKITIRADWYYNFTEGITNIPTPSGFFDFNPETTRGLFDFMVGYTISKKFSLLSSTLLFGRDRPSLPEDDLLGIPLRRGEQRYTQYLKLDYTKKFGKAKFQAHAGYSFSWADFQGPTFYANRAGFNDIGLSISRNILNSKTINLPFKAAVIFNPLTKNIYLQGTVSVIELSKFN